MRIISSKNGIITYEIICNRCNGTGLSRGKLCWGCYGSGVLRKKYNTKTNKSSKNT